MAKAYPSMLALLALFISQTELDSLARPTVPGFSIPTMTVVPNGGATQETINDGQFSGLYALIRNYDITTQATDSTGTPSLPFSSCSSCPSCFPRSTRR